jgi:pimeloyl-ACP methyl ester carboxylesterase
MPGKLAQSLVVRHRGRNDGVTAPWRFVGADSRGNQKHIGSKKANDGRRHQSITAPTLVMIGDAESVCYEHAVELLRLLPHSQPAVLPGSGRHTLVKPADWSLSMIVPVDFTFTPRAFSI